MIRKMSKTSFKKKDLENLQSMDYSSAKKVMDAMPVKMLAWVFSNYCSPDQFKQLFKEYGEGIKDHDPKVKKRYEKKLKALVRCLKKKRMLSSIPKDYRTL